MKSDRATAEREDGHGRSARTLPDWITPELIDETIRVWQPYYGRELTEDDAVFILDGTARLFAVLNSTPPTDDDPADTNASSAAFSVSNNVAFTARSRKHPG